MASGGNAAGAACYLYASLVNGTYAGFPPCNIYLGPDLSSFFLLGVAIANGAGVASYPIPVPSDAGLEGLVVNLQHVEAQAGGALLGVADLSNGLRVRVGNSISGCP